MTSNAHDRIFAVATGATMTDDRGNERPVHVHVSFRHDALENESATRQAGRRVFDKYLVARLHQPGSKDYLDTYLKRYPEGGSHFEVLEPALWRQVEEVAEGWERNAAEIAAGTPIALLNLDVTQAAALRLMGIATIEGMAQVPDGHLKNVPNGRELRNKAQAFLDQSKAAEPLAQAERENKALRDELAALRDEVAAMRREAVARGDDDDEPAPRRRRGRVPQEA